MSEESPEVQPAPTVSDRGPGDPYQCVAISGVRIGGVSKFIGDEFELSPSDFRMCRHAGRVAEAGTKAANSAIAVKRAKAADKGSKK